MARRTATSAPATRPAANSWGVASYVCFFDATNLPQAINLEVYDPGGNLIESPVIAVTDDKRCTRLLYDADGYIIEGVRINSPGLSDRIRGAFIGSNNIDAIETALLAQLVTEGAIPT